MCGCLRNIVHKKRPEDGLFCFVKGLRLIFIGFMLSLFSVPPRGQKECDAKTKNKASASTTPGILFQKHVLCEDSKTNDQIKWFTARDAFSVRAKGQNLLPSDRLFSLLSLIQQRFC